MKALSIASILALAITGTACSQSAEDTAEKPEAETETETEAAAETEVDMSGFNLGLPTEMETVDAVPAGEFNLDIGEASATSTDGFNLETDLGASSGLAEVPEIGTSITEEDAEETPEQPTDDEPVIRLD